MSKTQPATSFIIFLCLLYFFTVTHTDACAQSVNYSFSQTTETYTSIYTRGFDVKNGSSYSFTTAASNTTARFDFPFFFYVNGIQYYDLVISSNGFVTFGTTSPTSSNITPISGTEAYSSAVAAMGGSLVGGGYRPRTYVSGLAPNRVLTVEFKDFKRNGQSDILNFQYKFYESSNIIKITYGTNTTTSTATTVQVGLRGAANTDYLNRSGTDWSASSAGVANTASLQIKNTSVPPSGLTFTYTPAVCAAPLTSVSTPVLSSVTSSGLSGSFTGNGSSGYLVIRTESATAPAPVSGCNYPSGTFAAGGYIESNSAATTWTSAGLASAKTYWYWIYPYTANAGCSLFDSYKTTSPASASATTLTCTAGNNNTTVSAAGNVNWSACTWSLGHVPTSCESVTITYTGTTAAAAVLLDVDVAVKNLTLINASASTTSRDFSLSGFKSLIVDGDLVTSAAGAGSRYSRMGVNVSNRMLINGNVTIGTSNFTDGLCTIGSTGKRPEQTYLFKGPNVTFQRKGVTIDEHARFIFDGTGSQNLINNASADSATDPLLFEQLFIGDENAPALVCSGTWPLMDINDRNRGGVIIGTGATLQLPADISLNGWDGGCYFVMKANSTLKLGGSSSKSIDLTGSIKASALTNPVGSNFPLYFEYYQIDPTATIEYNGGNDLTQTVYETITYPKLIITNGSGSGRAQKNTIRNIQVNSTTDIFSGADLTLGSTWTNAGAYNVLTNGGLYCAANVVSGAGAFTLNTGGYLGMGHAQGITSGSTASGNIQMTGGRSFSTGGNYIYNGAVNQICGNGLPSVCNDLTIANSAVNGTVTISANQNVNGTNLLQSGTFVIDNYKINITGSAALLNSTGGQMKANKGILEINNTASATAQTLSGNWFTNKNISTLINSHVTGITIVAAPADTLLIGSALLYGTTGSTITTNGNITLLSRDTGTARFGNSVGNTITGDVIVERYLPTERKWRHLAVNTNTTQTVKQSWMENNSANGNTNPGYGTIVTDDLSSWSTNGFDSKSVSGPSIKYYNDATNTYTGISNTSTLLSTYNSYQNFVRGDRSCTPANSVLSSTILRTRGTLKTGTQTFNITAGKFTSVGNPYASAVDIRGLSRTNVGSVMYIWDPKLTGSYGLGAYQTLSYNSGNWTIIPGGGSYGTYGSSVDTIESGQAFYLKSSSVTGTVVFNESNKTPGARTMSRTSPDEITTVMNNRFIPDSTQTVYALLSLADVAQNTLVDGVMANYSMAFNNAVDSNDAEKMINTSENVSLLRENKKLVIEQRNCIALYDTLYLNMTGMRVHLYQWDIAFNNMDASMRTAYLSDNYLNTLTPLSLTSTNAIRFNVVNVPGAYAPDRFKIIFSQTAQILLPVDLSIVSAIRNADKSIIVKWVSETEASVSRYEIEQSIDGINFRAASTQLPAHNNSGYAAYTFTDLHAEDGCIYYRVKCIYLSGSVEYTSVIKVAALKQKEEFYIYPNPVTDKKIQLHLSNMQHGIYSYRIVNTAGQVIAKSVIIIEQGDTNKIISLPAGTASGNYILQITDDSGAGTSVPFLNK